MNWIKDNQIIIGALVIVGAIGAYAFLEGGNKAGDLELLRLNDECTARAEELVKKQSGTDNLGRAGLKVLHSIYDVERKSCFAEIDVAVIIEDARSPYKDFREWRIYDIIQEKAVSRWTYEGFESWDQTNSLKEYAKLKNEIFGLGIYE